MDLLAEQEAPHDGFPELQGVNAVSHAEPHRGAGTCSGHPTTSLARSKLPLAVQLAGLDYEQSHREATE